MGSPAKEASVGKLARVCLKLAFAPIIPPARLYLGARLLRLRCK